jgi:K+-transporting ATPase ATPase C chain
MRTIFTAIRVSVTLMLLCGLLYPLVTTAFAQLLFPKQAEGSLVRSGGAVVGSELLAQSFASPKLFHPRSSAAQYDPTSSAGSNRAVGSGDYAEDMAARIGAARRNNPALQHVPADLVTASGSGFDPDLSPEAAKAQIPRISKATGIAEPQLGQLVDSLTQGRQLGVFGEPRVNVLALNMALLKLVKP